MTEANPPAAGAGAVLQAAAEPVQDSDSFRQRVIVARTAVCLGALIVWQGSVSGGFIDPLWVSSPLLVAAELWHLTVSGELLADVWMTVSEALIAFVVSSVLGIVSG